MVTSILKGLWPPLRCPDESSPIVVKSTIISMKIKSEIEGDDWLWSSNAAPVVLILFQNKGILLLEIMLIND